MLIVLTMTVALSAMGAVMLQVLQGHLIRQLDQQLESTAEQLADSVANSELYGHAPLIPTDYYIRSTFVGEAPKTFLTEETEEKAGVPVFTGRGARQILNIESGAMSTPVTVDSTLRGAKWRVVAIPMRSAATNEPAGVVTVGLPLTGVSETILSTALSLLITAVVIITIGSAVGYYLVRRSLRPLQQIKSVAEEIAAGDLSSRIPPLPRQTEVGSLAESLNKMLAQIETSFDARRRSEQKVKRFVSDASHELRTPLAAIRGYAELYRIGAVEADQVADVMARIESESTRMGTLVANLLTLARIDEGQTLEIRPVDLIVLARDAARDLRALDPTREVSVEGLQGKEPAEPVMAGVDADKLTQVFVNLVGNIHRYTPADSAVEIKVGYEGDKAVIQLSDHGPGIAEEEQERVFERFYRADESRSRERGGSGLGLAIVGSIIHAHGGIVRLFTTPGGGLTVHIELKSLVKGVS